MAIGTAAAVITSFCHSGRLDRNATIAESVTNVISDRNPAHASATFSTRSGRRRPTASNCGRKIFVPPNPASTPTRFRIATDTRAARFCSGLAIWL